MDDKKYVLANGYKEEYFNFFGLTLNQAINELLDLSEKFDGNSTIHIDSHNTEDGPYLLSRRLETDEEYAARIKKKMDEAARVEKAKQDRIAKLKAQLEKLENEPQ